DLDQSIRRLRLCDVLDALILQYDASEQIGGLRAAASFASLEIHEFGFSRLSWKTVIDVWEHSFESMFRLVMVYAARHNVI
ncbi:unnamed protein product, partial [Caenorhabditis brenneri]